MTVTDDPHLKWIDPLPFDFSVQEYNKAAINDMSRLGNIYSSRWVSQDFAKLRAGHMTTINTEDREMLSLTTVETKILVRRYGGDELVFVDNEAFDPISLGLICLHPDLTGGPCMLHRQTLPHRHQSRWQDHMDFVARSGVLDPLIQALATRRVMFTLPAYSYGPAMYNQNILFWVDDPEATGLRQQVHIATTVPLQKIDSDGMRTFDAQTTVPVFVGTFDSFGLNFLNLRELVADAVVTMSEMVEYDWVCKSCGRNANLGPQAWQEAMVMSGENCIHCIQDACRTGVSDDGIVPDVG